MSRFSRDWKRFTNRITFRWILFAAIFNLRHKLNYYQTRFNVLTLKRETTDRAANYV